MLLAYDLYLAAVRQRLVHGEIEAGLRRLQGRAVERTATALRLGSTACRA